MISYIKIRDMCRIRKECNEMNGFICVPFRPHGFSLLAHKQFLFSQTSGLFERPFEPNKHLSSPAYNA